MASMERKHEICSPFIPQRNALRKTSAEIVSEARQSLRVQSTQRPFTPRDGQRQLFGKSYVRTDCDNRPPSTFSLHAQNFDAPDSRPGSGTHLSPLDHKPKFPVPCDAEDPFKAFPKPPTDPLEVKRGLAGARTRLLRAGSLTTLPPVEGHTDVKGRLNSDPGQKQLSAKGLATTDHTEVRRGPHKPGPRRTASESRIPQPGVDSGLRPTECRAGWRTGMGNGDNTTSTEEDAESLVWNNAIAPLLQQLEAVAAGSSEDSMDRLCDLCDGLHGTLAEADMLGRRCKRRSGILRTLFRLIDLNSAQLNLHITKLCLALCVSGNNLLNICKLIFKIGRSENNDILFQNNSIIDSLLGVLSSEDVSASGEALLYCMGTLKFLSGNSVILRLLLDKNCLGVAQKLIQRLCLVEDTYFTIAGHILVQLTATLRNLADHPDSRPLFVSFSILSELCLVLRHHHKDQDICTNISRIYSKLSSYSECRLALAQTPGCYQLFLELLSKHHQKQDLVVRLLFTLGNLTAKSNEARQQLFQCKGCVDTLLQLYDSYQQRNDSPRATSHKGPLSLSKSTATSVSVQEDEDVLVKLVRVLANMCIHPAVGPALANNTVCIQLLMETLELRSVHESEELLINVAATINNLSFYQEESEALRHGRLIIAKLMLKLVLSSSMDAMLEATRVYGNLSQSKDVRDFIMQNKVHQFVVTLLDSKSTEMCFSACGVLTNLALDPPNRVSLSLEGAAPKLADCLKDFGAGDWQLAGQVCQALWNIVGGCLEKLLDTEQRESLLEILTAYSDEEYALKWTQNEDVRDFHRACWELEFLPIAQKLIKTLQPPDLTA
ncbi:armadillo repeat-containing protein 2 [Thunnus albacares]|uniref:armadillo repeat-containing protein 2 n=1 Tax=Thunnus albacares TaxID=8236 RepID=UPI001CF6856E|nr:armadillo repeat-containing protein 2 [Thunnus albacares]XP_044185837.1 armadillo repeat-containing protein 2 [Thunnus albacares]XP_044185838.1 armadillo repeat-containing protein 2 [Thunnus albacares]